jgi:hypothetical protein
VQPHLPPGVTAPERPVAVRALLTDIGVAAGHRLVLLSIEDWGPWADLRFGRIATPGAQPLARRIPLSSDWSVSIDGQPAEVLDVAGRGDRSFSNGEVRIRPAPQPGSRLQLRAQLAPGAEVGVEVLVPGA